jgi:hypothetical protein
VVSETEVLLRIINHGRAEMVQFNAYTNVWRGFKQRLTISRQSAVYSGYCILECDKLPSRKQLPTFRKNLIPRHSGQLRTLLFRTLRKLSTILQSDLSQEDSNLVFQGVENWKAFSIFYSLRQTLQHETSSRVVRNSYIPNELSRYSRINRSTSVYRIYS